MKLIVTLIFVIKVCAATKLNDEKSYEEQWENFKSEYNKSYYNKHEDRRHYWAFRETLGFIEHHNNNDEMTFDIELSEDSDFVPLSYATNDEPK